MAVLAEWQSADSYSTRISDIKNGGGLNGSNKLVWGTTVKDDGSANTLTGGIDVVDWFFANQAAGHDTIVNYQPGEQIN
jgi:hypothetical protein